MRSTGGVVLGLLLAACGGPSSEGVADCNILLRHEGTTFTQAGFSTGEDATRLGLADLSECDDSGPGARGAYFPHAPDQVTVWSFAGHEPGTVLCVRLPGGGFDVFVNETMSLPEAESLRRDLARRRVSR